MFFYLTERKLMDVESMVGIGASAFTAISLVPQLVKVFKEKEAENVSLGMLAVLFCGLSLWIYYGIIKRDYIIITSNSVSLLLNIILTIVSVKYKNNKPS
jgi:MtN3 and saliva related transmembrane protein